MFVINKLLPWCVAYQILCRLAEALTSLGFFKPTQPDKTHTRAINHSYPICSSLPVMYQASHTYPSSIHVSVVLHIQPAIWEIFILFENA